MPETNNPPQRRFTLDEDRARNWLRHAVAAHTGTGHAPPFNDTEPARPAGDLPEIDNDWDPRAPGTEQDVSTLVRTAVVAGIIGSPTSRTADGSVERWDLEFNYSDDLDGGGYHFTIAPRGGLKLATFFEEMRKIGEPDATGIPAAMAILAEAVTSANATLYALDDFIAAHIPTRHGPAISSSGTPNTDAAGRGIMPNLPLRTILDLSTSHLSEQTCRHLNSVDGVIADKTRYGWLMWAWEDVSDRLADDCDWPPELLPALELARSNDCDYILFDRDAPRIDRLLTFNW